MNRFTLAAAACVATLAASLPVASAASTSQQELASVQYLVGTWSCAHTVGAFSGTYTTTYSNALGNHWLKQTYDFPTIGNASAPAVPVQSEWLMGYDEGRQNWVRFGAMSNGQYFAIRMADTGSGWAWKYVTLFKRTTPETPDTDAVFSKVSDSEYKVDGPTYPDNGVTVTEHHDCKKQ